MALASAPPLLNNVIRLTVLVLAELECGRCPAPGPGSSGRSSVKIALNGLFWIVTGTVTFGLGSHVAAFVGDRRKLMITVSQGFGVQRKIQGQGGCATVT